MKKQDEGFLQEAIALAEASVRLGGGPFGAVVVRAGEIIGRGHNRVTLDLDPSAHAEVQAIRDACQHSGDFSLKGCTLYVSCEPCTMCLAAAYWARVDRIIYAASASDAAEAGFDDVHIREELCRPNTERKLVMKQAMREQALPVFELWKANEDRQDY
jgi:tRNA(Arg) A34 adenosine deaminase TadA